VLVGPATAQESPPQTGFETSNGAAWTTHAQEQGFLAEVDQRSERVSIDVIGTTAQGRPVQLVQVGHPTPHGLEASLNRPTLMIACSQHGNEPAGREACLKTIRDLAFTDDPALIDLMSRQTFLFVPSANPDGRNSNSRGNSRGTDINRDHVGLATEEARAIAAVVRDWEPDFVMDLHEYGPGEPVLYDDDILYLWPRNLNVDQQVHDLAKSFAEDSLVPCVADAGYTSDEYGLDAVGDTNIRQTAGDENEGIMRNAMGLRNAIGILIESAVSMSNNPQQLPNEIGSSAGTARRRVASQRTVIDCTLSFMDANGNEVAAATSYAAMAKAAEGAALNVPVYFSGADNEAPPASSVIYPPPCRYVLGPADALTVADELELHGVESVPTEDGGMVVPLGQKAEPIIPLLLDDRGRGEIADATPTFALPLDATCGLSQEGDSGGGESPSPVTSAAVLVGTVGLAALSRRRQAARAIQ
jgi:hypothetical protein